VSPRPQSSQARSVAALACTVSLAALLGGCRGGASEDPPIHLVGDMDWQAKRLPQSESLVFADKRAQRPIDPHTVAHSRGHDDRARFLRDDDAFFQGIDASGKPIARMPIEVDAALLSRGEERYRVFCSPCHDNTGSGNGVVIQRGRGGFPMPVALYVERLKDSPDGEIFETITKGRNNMPGYAAQIPVEDRWAIVSWVRVLQQSQDAKIEDVPAADRGKILAAETEDM
jgi:mono/diheme cytochrome c family protein